LPRASIQDTTSSGTALPSCEGNKKQEATPVGMIEWSSRTHQLPPHL
jgi:hypothetical protein